MVQILPAVLAAGYGRLRFKITTKAAQTPLVKPWQMGYIVYSEVQVNISF
jgi:hypothetical protein